MYHETRLSLPLVPYLIRIHCFTIFTTLKFFRTQIETEKSKTPQTQFLKLSLLEKFFLEIQMALAVTSSSSSTAISKGSSLFFCLNGIVVFLRLFVFLINVVWFFKVYNTVRLGYYRIGLNLGLMV